VAWSVAATTDALGSPDMVSIDERPAEVADRKVRSLGGDLMIGKGPTPAAGGLVDRKKTRAPCVVRSARTFRRAPYRHRRDHRRSADVAVATAHLESRN